ncbi:helix-turn-helix transcriptional regulator [Monashia sp. NPDC004114]
MGAEEPPFTGRDHECRLLEDALQRVRAGESAVLVIRGEAGIGKTALMTYCGSEATDYLVVQIAGIESELELPFAALHQLCQPFLNHLTKLPKPQARALKVAFGLTAETTADHFVVGLAVLSLLAEAAGNQPLLCLIDDAQWLDEASSHVLGIVGRRLRAESLLLLVAVREEGAERTFPDLPSLTVGGLSEHHSRVLLTATVAGPLDHQVRDRIVAETRGNPLALLELPKGMTPTELAGGFAVPSTASVPGHIEAQYRRRIKALPAATQRLMLLAAADPTGDATLLWRAAHILDVGRDSALLGDQLLDVGSRVRFRHPLARSAAYAVASPEDRRAAHRALAAATDYEVDPDRRAWHLALAATGPDEETATELERTAGRAQARAGLPAAATLLQRSAALTASPARRAEREMAAAYAHVQAGSFDTALGLLARVEADAANDVQRARAEQLRGQIQFAISPGREAPIMLLRAARRLEALNVSLARETYLYAWVAAVMAGPLAESGGGLVDVSRAARSADRVDPVRPSDLLLDGLAAMVLDGRAQAQEDLRRAVDAFVNGTVSADDWLQWGILAQVASMALWDFDSYVLLSRRQTEVARESGALSPLSIALAAHGAVLTLSGHLETATALLHEWEAVNEVTGAQAATSHSLILAGYRGRPADALPLLSATIVDASERGEGQAAQLANWAMAVLCNGLGRYEDALTAAEAACADIYAPTGDMLVLPEVVEAARRTGNWGAARDAMDRLTAMTVIEGAEWGKGLQARCRALVSESDVAEQWYTEAIRRLRDTQLGPDLGRAYLLYGEWLRRENRRLDARHQLRTAHEMFVSMGAEAFAERARRELVATGERVRQRAPDQRSGLSAQEEHIARLARDGRTNSEIGSELFLSARTVEWHLRKVFIKLGISSRRELQEALPPSSG